MATEVSATYFYPMKQPNQQQILYVLNETNAIREIHQNASNGELKIKIDKSKLRQARHQVKMRIELLKHKRETLDKIEDQHEKKVLTSEALLEAEKQFNQYLNYRKQKEQHRNELNTDYTNKMLFEDKERHINEMQKRIAEEKSKRKAALQEKLDKKYSYLSATSKFVFLIFH